MPDIFTLYYGKRYRAVLVTTSRKKANITAHALFLLLKEELDIKTKQTVFIEHRGKTHFVFVKCPYDERVKKIK